MTTSLLCTYIRSNKKDKYIQKKDPPILSNHVDCGEAIKVEDIKEELNEMERVEDPLSLQLDNQTNHEEDNPCDNDE